MDKINQRLPPGEPLRKPKAHGILDLDGQMRGHEHDPTLLPVLRDDVLEQPGTLGIQRDGGLIQQPDRAVDGKQPGELQPLPLPHGEHPCLVVHEPAEAHELDGRPRPAAVFPLEELEPLHVLQNRELLLDGVLEGHPVELELVLLEHARGGDVVAVPEDLPRGGAGEARQHAEERGLAGAVGAREDQRRAVVDAEVDVAEHRLRVPHARDVVEEEPRRRGPERRHPAEWSGGSGAGESVGADDERAEVSGPGMGGGAAAGAAGWSAAGGAERAALEE